MSSELARLIIFPVMNRANYTPPASPFYRLTEYEQASHSVLRLMHVRSFDQLWYCR